MLSMSFAACRRDFASENTTASVEWGLVKDITTRFMWRPLVFEENICWVHGLRDPLRKISLSRCSSSIRRAVGATHLRFHDLQTNATLSQWLERTSPTKQTGKRSEIKLRDNTIK